MQRSVRSVSADTAADARAARLLRQCMGVWPSGTTYITMEDVKVPVENLIGAENNGFKYIMCVSALLHAGVLPRLTRLDPQVQFQPRALGADYPGASARLRLACAAPHTLTRCPPCAHRLAASRACAWKSRSSTR